MNEAFCSCVEGVLRRDVKDTGECFSVFLAKDIRNNRRKEAKNI